VDGNWKGAHFIGYKRVRLPRNERSNAITVTNGAFVPRVRLYWIDVRKDSSNSLPAKKLEHAHSESQGLSALPATFLHAGHRCEYVIGLTWTRQPGVRFLYHPSNQVTMGVSFENPDNTSAFGRRPTVVLPPL